MATEEEVPENRGEYVLLVGNDDVKHDPDLKRLSKEVRGKLGVLEWEGCM